VKWNKNGRESNDIELNYEKSMVAINPFDGGGDEMDEGNEFKVNEMKNEAKENLNQVKRSAEKVK